MIDQNQIEL